MHPPVKNSFEQSSDYFPNTPFSGVEEAWFWFVKSYEALHSGARVRGGHGNVVRPCEPVDIYTIAMRLFRQGFLNKEHMRVLSHYGQVNTPPNPRYHEQTHDCDLWNQAMAKLTAPMRLKGIIV